MSDRYPNCEFSGCGEPAAPGEELVGSKKFCDRHLAEFDAYLADKNYMGLARWWILSYGGEDALLAARGIQ
jgi:hypothetical protein